MYEVLKNDTLESISRKIYGTESQTQLIKDANPDLGDTLTPGINLITPSLPNTPTNKNLAVQSDNQDDVTILIDDKSFKFFTNVRIDLSMDSISTIEFEAPMESDNINFRNTFKPFSFRNIKVYIENQLMFTGTMINVVPSVSTDSKTVSISAYARCGVLNDCNPSVNQFERLEFNETKLSQIANEIIKPFGLSAIFKDSQGARFERVAIEPTETIWNFLTKLANKRELVITSDENGNLVFQKAITKGNLAADLQQGISPILSVTPSFNTQSYFSHITGIEPVEVGADGSRYTVKNNLLKDSIRPFVYKVEDTELSDMKNAVTSKMGRMFGNMVSYEIQVNTWKDGKNQIWKPNTFLKLKANDSMIYTSYTFLIKSVSLNKNSDLKTATLNIVLPESFTGNIPKVLPWEE